MWFKGYIVDKKPQQLFEMFLVSIEDKKSMNELLDELVGHFSVVLQTKTNIFCAVDKIRSIPLLFNNEIIFSCESDLDKGENSLVSLDEERILELRMSGYCLERGTIIQGLRSLECGEYVNIDRESGEAHFERYYTYQKTELSKASNEDLLEELKRVTLQVLEDCVKQADGKRIVVPLSAGYDSRLVVSGLKKLGVENVHCFSYGAKGNFESIAAKKIAEKLGYSWEFVENRPRNQRIFYKSKKWKEFKSYCNSYSASPFVQDVSILPRLKGVNIEKEKLLFINGNSGDFISGLHIDREFFENDKTSLVDIVKLVFKKHYSLWKSLKNKKNEEKIEQKILGIVKEQNTSLKPYQIYEALELINRQSKFVVSGQRSYEFWGQDWALPLWSNRYLDFWVKVPKALKKDQSLYRKMLHEENWGEVWEGIELNNKSIKPRWVMIYRFILKALFFVFGKENWHQIERNLVVYWTESVCNAAIEPYYKVALSLRGARHGVSWITDNYLREEEGKFAKK